MTLLDTTYIDEVLEPVITASVGYAVKPGNNWYIIITNHPSGTETHQNHNKAIFYETKSQAQLVADIVNEGFDTLD